MNTRVRVLNRALPRQSTIVPRHIIHYDAYSEHRDGQTAIRCSGGDSRVPARRNLIASRVVTCLTMSDRVASPSKNFGPCHQESALCDRHEGPYPNTHILTGTNDLIPTCNSTRSWMLHVLLFLGPSVPRSGSTRTMSSSSSSVGSALGDAARGVGRQASGFLRWPEGG
jgi:hypothetical protein